MKQSFLGDVQKRRKVELEQGGMPNVVKKKKKFEGMCECGKEDTDERVK